VDSITRGFTEATLDIDYPEAEVPDSNVTGGVTSLIGKPRSVNFSGTYYVDDTSQDYELLRNELTGTDILESQISFRLGEVASAENDIIDAIRFVIPTLRMTATDKVDGEAGRVLRTLTGYGVIASNATGFGSAENEELLIEFV
jgi:hypothetical protein